MEYQSISEATQPSHHNNRSSDKLWGCLFVGLVIFLIPLFVCGALITISLVFPPPPLDIIVLGVDARGNEGWVARTDSILLVGVRPSQFRVSLLSIPRDLFIDVPGYGLQRINTINALAESKLTGSGPQLVKDSIQMSFGVTVDRYIRLDFQAFEALIDAVGGIDIYVEKVIEDYAFPTDDGGTTNIRFESGWQKMDGKRALIYARTRHSDDDYARASRQQKVVGAFVAKLTNPMVWPAVLDVMRQYLDSDLTLLDWLQIAPSLLLSGGRFEQLVIDRDYILPADGYAVPNYERITPWLVERFD